MMTPSGKMIVIFCSIVFFAAFCSGEEIKDLAKPSKLSIAEDLIKSWNEDSESNSGILGTFWGLLKYKIKKLLELKMKYIVIPLKHLLGKDETIEFKTMFPGTQWCGEDNTADNENDLGPIFKKTDSCCKNHDLCQDSIAANKTAHGLYNNGAFTKSHCDCDAKFYKCLKNVNSVVAMKIGILYFDVVRMQCFSKDNSTQEWEWHNNPFYKRIF